MRGQVAGRLALDSQHPEEACFLLSQQWKETFYQVL